MKDTLKSVAIATVLLLLLMFLVRCNLQWNQKRQPDQAARALDTVCHDKANCLHQQQEYRDILADNQRAHQRAVQVLQDQINTERDRLARAQKLQMASKQQEALAQIAQLEKELQQETRNYESRVERLNETLSKIEAALVEHEESSGAQ